jgi:outer membrane receptor protein involved in Fe transport
MEALRKSGLRALLCATAISSAIPAMAYAQAKSNEPIMLDDVIVTANKREERLHDVPASVSVLTAATLEKHQINDAKDFPQFAPTLNFQAADEARLFNFSIRGIGTEAFSVAAEPSVAVIVDGVVYTRPGAAFDGLTDLERVEVLSGPQGTLQGKNASAGAVVIVTKNPTRDHWERRAEVTIAEDNERKANLVVSGPLNDQLAIRAYGYYGSATAKVINVADGKTRQQRRELWLPRQGRLAAGRRGAVHAVGRHRPSRRRLLRRADPRRRGLGQRHRRLHQDAGGARQSLCELRHAPGRRAEERRRLAARRLRHRRVHPDLADRLSPLQRLRHPRP